MCISRLKNLLAILIASLFYFSSASTVYSKPVEVVAHGKSVVTENMTLADARIRAVNDARIKAIESVAGISTNRVMILKDQLLVSDLIKTYTRGYIANEKIIKWSGDWLMDGRDNYPVVRVTIKGNVTPVTSNYFRDDLLSVSLDKRNYRNGENVFIEVETKQDVYLLLLNYNAKGTVSLLFPNSFSQNNYLSTGDTKRYPREKLREPSLVARTFPGHKSDTEAVFVFGLPVTKEIKNYAWLELLSTENSAEYGLFMEKLHSLPVDWIAENVVIYTVHDN